MSREEWERQKFLAGVITMLVAMALILIMGWLK